MLIPLLIFLGTYLVLAIGRLPGFRVDRTGAAIIGASLMIAFGVLSLEEAFQSINYETILLLFGMMIVAANLRLSGFFGAVSTWVVEHAHRPLPPALRHRIGLGRVLRLLRERHHVSGADPPGARNRDAAPA